MRDKKILVCGMAKSGQAAARFLAGLGANVTVQDLNGDIALPFLNSAGAGQSPPSAQKTCEKSLCNFSQSAEENIKSYLGQNPDAILHGFDLIVISPGIPIDTPFIAKAHALGIDVIGEVELAYLYTPCPVIGITGTNGKTTVTTLLGEILRRHNPRTVIAGNIGVPYSGQVSELTEDSLVVAEISSFQLESTATFAPWISAVLNITPDHLDRHGDMQTYINMKERIFAAQRPGQFCVLGYDNPITKNMRPPCDRIFFSAKEILEEGVFLDGGMIKARLARAGLPGISAEELEIVDISAMRILPENALAAAALALCAGAAPALIAEGLLNFAGVPHRIEYVTTAAGIEFYNDSKATNTDSAIKGLAAMRRTTVLLGGGYDKEADFSDWVECFEGKVRHLVLLGEVADKIIAACRARGFERYTKAASLRDAVRLAVSKAEEGDAVLLSPACASWDMFENFEQRGDLFKELVREFSTGYKV